MVLTSNVMSFDTTYGISETRSFHFFVLRESRTGDINLTLPLEEVATEMTESITPILLESQFSFQLN